MSRGFWKPEERETALADFVALALTTGRNETLLAEHNEPELIVSMFIFCASCTTGDP